MKRLLAYILSLCLVIGMIPLGFVFAVDSVTFDDAVASAIGVTNENDNSLVAQKGTPTIDAEIDDVWYTAQWYKAGANYQDNLDNGQTLHDTTYFAVLWDDYNIYVMVYTTGFESFATSGDELRLGFHVGRSETDTGASGTRNVWMVDYVLAGNTTWQNWYENRTPSFDINALGANAKKSDTTGIVEFKFPVNELFKSDGGSGWTNAVGHQFGLAAIWVDANAETSANRTFLFFNTDGYYNRPADYMTFTLADGAVEEPPVEEPPVEVIPEASGATAITPENQASLTAQKGTPTIDGNIDAIWGTTTWYKADPKFDGAANGTALGDYSYVAVLWDEQNVYFLVYSAGFADFASSGDYICFGVDIGRDGDLTGSWSTRNSYALDYSLNGSIAWQNWYGDYSSPLTDGSIGSVNKLSETSGILEFKLPIDTLYRADGGDGWTNEVEDELGLFVKISDNGSNGSTAIYFNDSGLSALDQYMTVKLVDNAPTYLANLTTTFGEVTVGNTMTVKIDANKKSFASGEITLTYDTALSFAGTNLEDAEVKDDENGTVTIVFYGATKSEIEVYFVGETAKEEAAVTITYAAFSTQEEAATEDLTEAALGAASVAVDVLAKTFTVVLPEGLEAAGGATGTITVKDGDTLKFKVTEEYAQVYKDIAVKLGETELTVGDDDYYSITVTANVDNITISGTARSFSVKLGDEEPVADAATYLTNYEWKLPYTAAEGSVNGSKTKITGVTIGGVEYKGYIVTGEDGEAVLTIPGADIKGNIVITYETETIPADKWSVSVNGTGAGAADGFATTVDKNGAYTLTITTAPAGYKYVVTATMGGADVTLDNSVANKYTIDAVTGNVVFTIEKVILSDVKVYDNGDDEKVYVRLSDGTALFLVINKVAEQDGIVYTYNDVDMFWSAEYEAYCVLVAADSATAAVTGYSVAVKDGTTKEVAYDGDVNMASEDEVIDANDAQLVYNMYNATYAGFTADVTMEKFLRADVTGDGIINVGDATAIVNEILK